MIGGRHWHQRIKHGLLRARKGGIKFADRAITVINVFGELGRELNDDEKGRDTRGERGRKMTTNC